MGIKVESYMYGEDADGRRGMEVTEVTAESDISGDELDEEDIYEYDNQLCSYDELLELLKVKFSKADRELMCECGEKIEIGDDIAEVDGQYYHEDCFDQWIDDNFHISLDTAYDSYYTDY